MSEQSKSEKYLREHRLKHPLCVSKEACPHWKEYAVKVIFIEPDNGFIGHAEAYTDNQARALVEAGIKRTHPHLHIKSIEVKLWHEVFGDIPYMPMPQ